MKHAILVILGCIPFVISSISLDCPCVAKFNGVNITDAQVLVGFRDGFSLGILSGLLSFTTDQCSAPGNQKCNVPSAGAIVGNNQLGCYRVYAYSGNVRGNGNNSGDKVEIGGCGGFNYLEITGPDCWISGGGNTATLSTGGIGLMLIPVLYLVALPS